MDEFRSEFIWSCENLNMRIEGEVVETNYDIFRENRHLKRLENVISFADCVTFARYYFEEVFINRAKRIALAYNETSCLEFSTSDSLHLNFVRRCAEMYAKIYGVERAEVDYISILNFVKISAYEDSDEGLDERVILPPNVKKLTPLKIDAFDELFCEHAFNHCCLSCKIFSIPCVTMLEMRRAIGDIHGKLFCLVSSTTALAAVQIYNLFGEKREIAKFRNSVANFAKPMLHMIEPLPCKRYKSDSLSIFFPEGHSDWNTIDIYGDISGEEFISMMNDYKPEGSIDTVACGNKLLIMTYLKNRKANKTRLSAQIKDEQKRKFLLLSAMGSPAGLAEEEGEEIFVEFAKIRLFHQIWRERCFDALIAWLIFAKRKKLPRDIQRYIGEMIYASRNMDIWRNESEKTISEK